MKTNSERRNFFKKAGLSIMSAGVVNALPFNLFSKNRTESKEQNVKNETSIQINPMAVKREKRK